MAGTKKDVISSEDWQWKVENAARTLTEAAKIKRDKKLYNAAVGELKKQKQEITKVISDR